MNTRALRFLAIPLLLLTLYACTQATYPKEKVEQSVIDLCKEEYDLDVKAKIIEGTLGVFIPIEKLIDDNLQLNADATSKIEDAALSIHRVTMSTDEPLKFYTLTARDINTPGAEFMLTAFVYDVIRVRLLDISRGEYHKRTLKDFRFNPIVAGEEKIKELFNGLNENSPLVEELKPLFYPIYTIGKKDTQKIEVQSILSKEISIQESLFYVKTKEYYKPLPGLDVYTSIFPSGFDNEYLILLNLTKFPNPLQEIASKYFYSGTEIRQRNLKESFDSYKDRGYIGKDGLPKKGLELGWFLSQQITRRITMLSQEDKKLKGKFNIQNSQGSIDNKIFQFRFSLSPIKALDEDKKTAFLKIMKLCENIFRRYSFEDFEGIELIDITPDGKKVFLSKSELKKFGRNKKVLLNKL